MNQQYEVQTRIGEEWENVWAEEKRIDGKLFYELVKFDTMAQAQKELDDHLAEMEREGMDHDPDDYRIVPCAQPSQPAAGNH